MSNYRIPFLRGNTKLRDHTHWRMGDATISTPAPNLDDMMKLSWRVKSWTLSGSLVYTFPFKTLDQSSPETQHSWTGTVTTTLTDLPVSLYARKLPTIVSRGDSHTHLNPMPSLATMVDERQVMDFGNPEFSEWISPTIDPTRIDPIDRLSGNYIANKGNFGFWIAGYAPNSAGHAELGVYPNDTTGVFHTITVSFGGAPAGVTATVKVPFINFSLMNIGINGLTPPNEVGFYFDETSKLFLPQVDFIGGGGMFFNGCGAFNSSSSFPPLQPLSYIWPVYSSGSDPDASATDPGANYVKVNNIDVSLATAIYISASPYPNPLNDFGNIFTDADDGTNLSQILLTFGTKYALFQYNGAPVRHGTTPDWLTIPVTLVATNAINDDGHPTFNSGAPMGVTVYGRQSTFGFVGGTQSGPRFASNVTTLHILGWDIPLGFLANDTYGGAVGASFVSGDWTLTPAEYWPYKNLAGAAVYDTTTGAQINDPFG